MDRHISPVRGVEVLMRNRDEIEELIQAAAQEKYSVARQRLFRALYRVEVFFPLQIQHNEGKEVKATPLLRLSDGTSAMMLYASKSHKDLPDNCGGGNFEDALAAALDMPALDWVILSNRASQWVAIRKEQISAILDDLQSYGRDRNGPLMTSDGNPAAGKMLEDLITRAVDSPPEELSPRIESELPGRELYLELIAGQGEEGQPVMKTFQINDLANVLRVYLSRRRPDIIYGGIGWEALKEMIESESEIGGVQIVNDADDWVVFDRESLRSGPRNEPQ
jgi:hypothetical protein